MWKQIIGAVVLIILVKAVETTGLRTARSDPDLWYFTYLQSVAGFCDDLVPVVLVRPPLSVQTPHHSGARA